jgi:hypothetical protein
VIEPPKRAVTRFFVPLIDVLILLFCIFLLMPFVSRPDGSTNPNEVDVTGMNQSAEELRQKVVELELQLEQARQQIKQLRDSQANSANRMSVRVLEIDATTGKLFQFDPDSPEPRQEVRDQADAQRLIDQQKRLARGKELFILMLYPRKLTGYPTQPQIDTYRRWFQDVSHGFDNPWDPAKP